MNLLAIDFDGVIMQKGAGSSSRIDSCDRPPVDGAIEGMRALAAEWPLVVHSCRATSDRGVMQVWQWLKRHKLGDAVQDVTATKPIATAYIDDRAVRFTSWQAIRDTYTETPRA